MHALWCFRYKVTINEKRKRGRRERYKFVIVKIMGKMCEIRQKWVFTVLFFQFLFYSFISLERGLSISNICLSMRHFQKVSLPTSWSEKLRDNDFFFLRDVDFFSLLTLFIAYLWEQVWSLFVLYIDTLLYLYIQYFMIEHIKNKLKVYYYYFFFVCPEVKDILKVKLGE